MPRGRKKKAASRPKSARHEEKCSPEFAFMAIDGSSFHSLKDFSDALEHMSDDTFYYHVSDTKNDFSNWIRDVFKEAELADKLVKARTKDRHEIVMLRWLLRARLQ